MAQDRASRHLGLATYRSPVAGRSGEADLFQPRFRATPDPGPAERVTAQERLDLLAFRLTGDPHGFWRLADASRVYDPLSLLEPGATVRAPRRRP